ncbi:hypothetical protein B296_00028209 [Ensete ventricosum]|uniref:Uncharacterized protein n=1 Tax=Ensete ventricosum TaxID=4639 RepID=A0A426ZNV5_ENSVE|nr:hypothetical protein B296_00028209 [Ensete ventricosum]
MASDSAADAAEVEKLYEFGERLNEAKDKSMHVSDYEGIIAAVKGQSVKAKQLAAQLIPRFFKFFPTLASKAMTAQFDLVEEDELGIRVQAIRGLPLLCKDTPEYVSKIVDVLGQLLTYDLCSASQFSLVDGWKSGHLGLLNLLLPEERKLDLLKNLAGSSPYAAAQDSRQLLPSIVTLLKILELSDICVMQTPNSTNSLCGYKIVTGQPSDRLGEDFSENFKDFTER